MWFSLTSRLIDYSACRVVGCVLVFGGGKWISIKRRRVWAQWAAEWRETISQCNSTGTPTRREVELCRPRDFSARYLPNPLLGKRNVLIKDSFLVMPSSQWCPSLRWTSTPPPALCVQLFVAGKGCCFADLTKLGSIAHRGWTEVVIGLPVTSAQDHAVQSAGSERLSVPTVFLLDYFSGGEI